jgi:uncharacterized peroxidase-related enzyme
MSRIAALDPETTDGMTRETLIGIGQTLGGIPNLFRVAANSPSTLESLVALNRNVASGKLDSQARSLIALAVAEANDCDYCLSANSVLGVRAGLEKSEVELARSATSDDPRRAAMLSFARKLVLARGHVSDADLASLTQAGIGADETLEIISNVTLSILMNYLNLVAGTDNDFPPVRGSVRGRS